MNKDDWSREEVSVLARKWRVAARLGLEEEPQDVVVERPGKRGLGMDGRI